MKVETKQIGEHSYTAMQLPPTQSIPLGIRLLKVVSPGLSKIDSGLIDEVKTNGLNADISKVFPMIEGVLMETDPDTTMELLKKLLTSVKRDGIAIHDIDSEFMDCPMDIFKVAMLVIEVNFKSFFPGSGSFMERLNIQPKVDPKSEQQSSPVG